MSLPDHLEPRRLLFEDTPVFTWEVVVQCIGVASDGKPGTMNVAVEQADPDPRRQAFVQAVEMCRARWGNGKLVYVTGKEFNWLRFQ